MNESSNVLNKIAPQEVQPKIFGVVKPPKPPKRQVFQVIIPKNNVEIKVPGIREEDITFTNFDFDLSKLKSY